MKTATIIRNAAALVLSLAAMTTAAEAQSVSTDTTTSLIAMTSVRDVTTTGIETRAARRERMIETVAEVKGYEAEAGVRAAIEAQVSEEVGDVKVLRAVMTSGEWQVKMTELGIPKSEYRRGVVVYQMPGQDVLVQQQIVVERPYFTLDGNDGDYAVRLGTPRVR